MYVIENDAVETARVNMEKAFEEVKSAEGAEHKRAVGRYLEASRAYRTILTQRYNL